VGGNRLFISRDRGETWERTPDLSRRIDRDTVSLMGVLGRDITLSRNDGTGSFGEAVSIGESPLDPMVLWVGMDDGNLQRSRDGGASWEEVSGNVPGVPPGTYVSRITPSVAGPGTAYAAFDAHRDGDFSPYVFRTTDFGSTWEPLMAGLPSGSVNEVVEHPDNPAVLFLGSEHHLFVSTDAGAHWAKWPGMPTTHYDDLLIHPRDMDLIVGTHGRGAWIVDNVTPLQQLTPEVMESDLTLLEVRPEVQWLTTYEFSWTTDKRFYADNPPTGSTIPFYSAAGGGTATIEILNIEGDAVRTMEVEVEAGLNTVFWDQRGDPPPMPDFPDDMPQRFRRRPMAQLQVPGQYLVRLTVGADVQTTTLVIEQDEPGYMGR
jgi:photosystem II stability/assembly factor-like uncharacterized protein